MTKKTPAAVRAYYNAQQKKLVFELTNGVTLMVPRRLLKGLEKATAEQLDKVTLLPGGTGLRWEDLDVELSVARLVREASGGG